MNEFDWIYELETDTKIMAIITYDDGEEDIGWSPDVIENLGMMMEWKKEQEECINVEKVTLYTVEEI